MYAHKVKKRRRMLPPPYRNYVPNDISTASKPQPQNLSIYSQMTHGVASKVMMQVHEKHDAGFAHMKMSTTLPKKMEIPKVRVKDTQGIWNLGLGHYNRTNFPCKPVRVGMSFDMERVNKGNWDPKQTRFVKVSTFE